MFNITYTTHNKQIKNLKKGYKFSHKQTRNSAIKILVALSKIGTLKILNPPQPTVAYLYPLKTSKNLQVFSCFQVVQISNTRLRLNKIILPSYQASQPKPPPIEKRILKNTIFNNAKKSHSIFSFISISKQKIFRKNNFHNSQYCRNKIFSGPRKLCAFLQKSETSRTSLLVLSK